MTPRLRSPLSRAMALAILLAACVGPAIAGEPAPFRRGSWRTLLHAQAGRPAIVHLWGLKCAPCLAELPEWGKLMKERPDLNLILLHAEKPTGDDDARRIAAVLARVGLEGAESWMFADAFEERLRFEIDRDWRGETPHTLLVGRDGAVAALPGAADFDRIRRWLDDQARTR